MQRRTDRRFRRARSAMGSLDEAVRATLPQIIGAGRDALVERVTGAPRANSTVDWALDRIVSAGQGSLATEIAARRFVPGGVQRAPAGTGRLDRSLASREAAGLLLLLEVYQDDANLALHAHERLAWIASLLKGAMLDRIGLLEVQAASSVSEWAPPEDQVAIHARAANYFAFASLDRGYVAHRDADARARRSRGLARGLRPLGAMDEALSQMYRDAEDVTHSGDARAIDHLVNTVLKAPEPHAHFLLATRAAVAEGRNPLDARAVWLSVMSAYGEHHDYVVDFDTHAMLPAPQRVRGSSRGRDR